MSCSLDVKKDTPMRCIYIAGPFRASSSWYRELNIRRAEELALRAWRSGFAVICPHTNTRFFEGAADDQVWLKGAVELMKRCDAVLLTSGWENSKGTQMEMKVAKEVGIPVFDELRTLMQWRAHDQS